VDLHQQDGQLHRCTGQRIDAYDLRQEQQNGPVEHAHGDVGPDHQLFGVVHGLLTVARTDAAAHHRDHGKAQRLARDGAHAVKVVGHGIGRDLHRAKGGDHAHHQNAPGLEQAVLKGRRDADAQDALCHLAIQLGGLGHGEGVAFLVAAGQNEGRRHHAGNDAGPGNTVHSHFQAKDADRVAHDVDDVHEHTDLHGNFGVAHTAEEGRARIVQRQKGVAQGRDL